MNAVEREPVETRVLNPTASEASNKPEQRSYRKPNIKKKLENGAEKSGTETARRRIVQRRIGGAETYLTHIYNIL